MHSLSAILLLGMTLAWQSPALPKDGMPNGMVPDYALLRERLYGNRSAEQSQAALLLVQSGSTEAQELVRESLRRWDRPDVFKAAASAVGLWRDSRYLHPLLQALSADSAEVRQTAGDALARLDARTVVRWLLALAEDNAQPSAPRTAAINTLGRCLHKSAVVALLKLVASENQAICQAAGLALEEVSGQQYGTNALKWQGWWLPYKDCTEEEWLAARATFFAERNRGLQDRLRRAEESVLEMHQKLYARTPPQGKVEFCKEARQSDNAEVRKQVIAWMGALLPDANGTDKTVLTDLLLLSTRDGVESVQQKAVLVLENVDDSRAVERLLDLLTPATGSSSIRAAAARGLGKHRGSRNSTPLSAELKARTLNALDHALNDAHPEVVASAAESLGALEAYQAAPRLADLLRHPSDLVRQRASLALEQVPAVQVLPAVLAGLDDPVETVRLHLVGVLGKVGGKETGDAKLQEQMLKRLAQVLVQDTARAVRSRAATVLGDLGGPAELTLLWQRVKATEDELVRLKAWQGMIDILSRSLNWQLVSEWDQELIKHKATDRRLELFTALRERWSKNETAKPLMDSVTASLIQAQLGNRKWVEALPLAQEMARRATTDGDLRDRLRWLLVIGRQALEDKKLVEVQQLLKETEELVRRCRDLAPEFEALRQQTIPNGNGEKP
jgi:HEAT repeat protein